MPNAKRGNVYKINLQEVQLRDGRQANHSVEFEFENHDDLFKIIEIMKERNLFFNQNDAIEFSIGLKLLTEVLLKNKNHPLFEDFSPAVMQFMKKLKSQATQKNEFEVVKEE